MYRSRAPPVYLLHNKIIITFTHQQIDIICGCLFIYLFIYNNLLVKMPLKDD